MGSWANSFHVRHDDPKVVAGAIRDLLALHQKSKASQPKFAMAGGGGDGDIDDDEVLDYEIDGDDDTADLGPRRLRIMLPNKGWISILDSEGLSNGLVNDLSKSLNADVLWIGVNDSDGWMFQLVRDGVKTAEFDSLGESESDEDEENAFHEKLNAASERGDEAEVDRLMAEMFGKSMPKGPIVGPDGLMFLPPDLALLGAKVKEGRASFWERLRYKWGGLRFLFQVITGRLRPGKSKFGFDIPQGKELTSEEIAKLAKSIKDFFPGADEAKLRDLLPQSRFPAEALLGEFLEIVGMPRLYEGLSYDYYRDFSKSELKSEGIVEADHIVWKP